MEVIEVFLRSTIFDLFFIVENSVTEVFVLQGNLALDTLRITLANDLCNIFIFINMTGSCGGVFE
jgi:hypothetical protein